MRILHIQQRPEIPEDCKGFVIEANGKFYVGIRPCQIKRVEHIVWTGLFSRLCLVSYEIERYDTVRYVSDDFRNSLYHREVLGESFDFSRHFVPEELYGYKTRGEAERVAEMVTKEYYFEDGR